MSTHVAKNRNDHLSALEQADQDFLYEHRLSHQTFDPTSHGSMLNKPEEKNVILLKYHVGLWTGEFGHSSMS